MAAPKQQKTNGFELHPLSVIHVLWKRRYRIVVGWVALCAVGFFAARQLPVVYQAEAVVLVDSQKIPERFVASTVEGLLQDQLSSTKQQVLSSAKLQKIIDGFQLYREQRKTRSPEELIGQMRQDVQITMDKTWGGSRPGAFRIAYQGPVPSVVAGVVNEIASLFINENVKTRELRAEGTSDFLDSQLQEARQNLEEQEGALGAYKSQRMGELPQQEAALSSKLARLQAELQGNQDAMNRAEQNRLMLENTLRMAEASERALERATRQRADPSRNTAAVAALPELSAAPKARRSEVLEAQLTALKVRYSDEHPEILRLKAELNRVRKQEEQEERAAPAVVATGTEGLAAGGSAHADHPRSQPGAPLAVIELNRERERVSTAKLQLAMQQNDIEIKQAERRRILKEMAEYQARIERIPIREQEMSSLTRDYEISRQHYTTLLNKKISAEMATAMERRQQAERFTLLDPARVPTKPIKPKLPLIYAGIAGGSLCISLLLPLGLELRKNTVLGEWELPADVKVVGRISMIRPSGSPARAISPDNRFTFG